MIILRRCRPRRFVRFDPPECLFSCHMACSWRGWATRRLEAGKGPCRWHRETTQVCTAPQTTKGKEGNVSSAIWGSSWSQIFAVCFGCASTTWCWSKWLHRWHTIPRSVSCCHLSNRQFFLKKTLNRFFVTSYQRAIIFCQRLAQPS